MAIPDAADELEDELVVELLPEQPSNAATTIAAPATLTMNRGITRFSICSCALYVFVVAAPQAAFAGKAAADALGILGGFARRSEPGKRHAEAIMSARAVLRTPVG
jgi:hypothetical protein